VGFGPADRKGKKDRQGPPDLAAPALCRVLIGLDLCQHLVQFVDVIVVAGVFVQAAIFDQAIQIFRDSHIEADGVEFLDDPRGAEKAVADPDFGITFIQQVLVHLLSIVSVMLGGQPGDQECPYMIKG